MFPYFFATAYLYTGLRYEKLMETFSFESTKLNKQALQASERSTQPTAYLINEVEAEHYFGYLLDLVKDSKRDAQSEIALYGLIRTHWYTCKKRKRGDECLCVILV